MSKIALAAAKALLTCKSFKKDNVEVKANSNNTSAIMFLYDKPIATLNKETNEFMVTLAGWATKTTKDYLNAIPGVHVRTLNGIHLINGSPVTTTEWVKVEYNSLSEFFVGD